MYKLIMSGDPEACSETTRVGLIHTRDRFSRESPSNLAFTKGAQIRNGMCSTSKKSVSKRGSGKAPYRILVVRSRTLNSLKHRPPGKLTRKYNQINPLGKVNSLRVVQSTCKRQVSNGAFTFPNRKPADALRRRRLMSQYRLRNRLTVGQDGES